MKIELSLSEAELIRRMLSQYVLEQHIPGRTVGDVTDAYHAFIEIDHRIEDFVNGRDRWAVEDD